MNFKFTIGRITGLQRLPLAAYAVTTVRAGGPLRRRWFLACSLAALVGLALAVPGAAARRPRLLSRLNDGRDRVAPRGVYDRSLRQVPQRLRDTSGRRELLAPVTRPSWRHAFLIEHLAGPPQRDVPSYCAVRGERYKYVLYQTREEELYDLLRDPHELDNIAPHPAVRSLKRHLRRELARLCNPPPPGYTALAGGKG